MSQPQPTAAALSEHKLVSALVGYFRGCDLTRSPATFEEVRDLIADYGDGYRLARADAGQVRVSVKTLRQIDSWAAFVGIWTDEDTEASREITAALKGASE